MAIRTIEVICAKCPKCERMIKIIRESISSFETKNKVKISYEFKHTTNLREADKYSINISKVPIVVVNGGVEFSGQMEPPIVRGRLDVIHRS